MSLLPYMPDAMVISGLRAGLGWINVGLGRDGRTRRQACLSDSGVALKRKLTCSGRFALTGLAAATLCLAMPSAMALGLGRLNVKSALGETMQAEIDVTSLSPEEQANLRIRIAPPDAYRAAGVDYNQVLPSARASLQRRPDGRMYIRVTSDRGVQEPFVDVILEISWATGRLVREYTMLFDPPAAIRAQAPAAPGGTTTSPVVSAAPPAPTPLPPAAQTQREARAAAREAERQAARERRESARAAAAAARERPAPASGSNARTAGTGAGAGAAADAYRVESGDTLSRIADRVQRPGVSLDQMLVALFRANPSAFMGDNMNRLRAGVVLSVPTAEAAQATPAAEARRTIVAQSADFGAYRQRLASATTAPRETPNARSSTGRVQASVEDRKPGAPTTPDRLTLSKGAAASAADDRLVRDREKQAADTRVAELNRNLQDLRRMQGAASTPAATPAPAPAPVVATTPAPARTAPALAPAPAPAPAPAVAPPPAILVPAPAPAIVPPVATQTASAPMTAASVPAMSVVPPVATSASVASGAALVAASPPTSAPVAARPASRPAARPAARSEPSFLDSLLENPLYLGAGLLVLLLALFGLYRFLQRSKKDSGETSFLESRLQPDSFFGASGGQRIDTRDAASSSSSMTYSLSQLDAIGDVDPVAEADVYLAYGRDLQAEEILKEAMRSNPERLAIRAKLLEVYAKRRDIKGFELLATQLFALTRGEGEDWTKTQELGGQIDPDNPLYRAGGTPQRPGEEPAAPEPLGASTLPASVVPVPSQYGASVSGDSQLRGDSQFAAVDLDLDNPDVGSPSEPMPFDATESIPPNTGAAASYDSTHKMPLTTSNEPGVKGTDARDEPLAFDLSGISLDLDQADTRAGAVGAIDTPFHDDAADQDPLARKLELAEEFQRIGDKDGARDLLREVLATASGATKTKAQAMLEDLG